MNQTIIDAAKMRKFDALTLENQHITSLTLMQRVGKIMAEYMLKQQLVVPDDDILVVAGIGNNGGDALVIADALYNHGMHPNIVVVGNKENQSDESKTMVDIVTKHNQSVTFIESEDDLSPLKTFLGTTSILIDGIFGIGLIREITGIYHSVMTMINQYDSHVISIDMPSGIHADNGLKQGIAIRARDTLIVQTLKQGHILNDGLIYTGRHHILDVGILAEYTEEETQLLDQAYYQRFLQKRNMLSHKYHYGHVLTIGGTKGMMGAPLLTAYAAMRCGSGLSSILYFDTDQAFIPSYPPELMVDTYSGIASLTPKLENKQAVVLGMGLPKDDPIRKESLNHILKTDLPLVVDASGLVYLKALIDNYSERGNIIITPHVGEFAQFLGIPLEELKQNLVLYAKNVAHKYHLTVVLKGPVTIITNDTYTYFSQFANPGMATAGSGDVLAGMICSFLGQGHSPLEASILGVSVHSHAGNSAKQRYGEASLIATDIIDAIHDIIKD
ncbi:MAG: NAD(P)H-hydrate dehydratase [Candidatus Izimaplasma sp.]|nr:NAD(P)H-hydrate dehydratase [Candidatus Izimaplasma bacterium]